MSYANCIKSLFIRRSDVQFNAEIIKKNSDRFLERDTVIIYQALRLLILCALQMSIVQYISWSLNTSLSWFRFMSYPQQGTSIKLPIPA